MARSGRRVVVKLGTNVLTGADGQPDAAYLEDVAAQLAELRAAGDQVIVVTSGAIGAGQRILGFTERVREVTLRQACAAVGQARLMRAWERAFAAHDAPVAQLLLTRHSFTNRSSYVNLRNATERLLELGVVPVVNENDTVSIDEIGASFGDNDRLSAYMATKVDADLLIILSDVDGLHTRPPGEPGAERVPVVEEVTPEVAAMAGEKSGSGVGRGGMASKVDAAGVATRGGTAVVIAHGRAPRVVLRAAGGEDVGTRFLPRAGEERGKASWLRIARPQGRVHVDAGAAAALRRGRHLLPAGVTRVEGVFPELAVVDIVHGGRVVAKARSTYASRDLDRVKGAQSAAARAALGREGAMNVTRKNDLLLLDGGGAPTG